MERILNICEVGNPILESKCERVDIANINEEILEQIKDMKETLKFSEGYGLAAPQVGINKRIVIIKVNKENCNYENAEDVPETVMINPVWEKLNDETDVKFEGCLSVPEIRGKVRRYKNIKISYYDEKGNKIETDVKDFTARLVQHECDHLDGLTFLNRVEGPHGFATKDMIRKFELNKM